MTRVSEMMPKKEYSREEVCRLLGVRETVLEDWEAHEFVARAEQYAFRELVALKTLRQLRARRMSAEKIRLILNSLRAKLVGVQDPLTELKIFTDGRRLAVQVDGKKMEALSGQLLLDFDKEEIKRLLQFPGKRAEETLGEALAARQKEAVQWFERGVEMEQVGAPAAQIIEAYERALERDPDAAGPHVNLGTVYFHLKNWEAAEKHYRAAIERRKEYALAHFNLGNLHDELNAPEEARKCYERALEIEPGYADAHYNLALLHQGKGETLSAVKHWRTYLKLDPAGYWAGIARRELQRLRQEAVVGGAGRG